MPRLLTAFRDHLIANGVVRDPDTAGPLPVMWLEPRLGTPAPGEGQGTGVSNDVTAAFLTGGLAPGPYASWHRLPYVEVRIRARQAWRAEEIELAMTAVLIDRRDWDMGAPGNTLHVIECLQIGALQRLGSDEQGYEHVVAYSFELPRY